MSDATFQPNPKGLSTFTTLAVISPTRQDPLGAEGSDSPFYVDGIKREPSMYLKGVIDAAQGENHALIGFHAPEHAVFSCFPGLGRASVKTTFDGFEVTIHHPAMGRYLCETHTCETPGEVLAVLATVSYG